MLEAARALLALLVTVGLLWPLPVLAQQGPAPEESKEQVFNFEEDEISTDYLKPNTMVIEGMRRGRSSSLISVRLDFVDEIVKSAEDI